MIASVMTPLVPLWLQVLSHNSMTALNVAATAHSTCTAELFCWPRQLLVAWEKGSRNGLDLCKTTISSHGGLTGWISRVDLCAVGRATAAVAIAAAAAAPTAAAARALATSPTVSFKSAS